MTSIIFSQANGFPAATYNVVTNGLRGYGYEVFTQEKLNPSRNQLPATNIWSVMEAQISKLIDSEFNRTGKPIYLVGHCLGGMLQLICANKNPDKVAGVVLLDSPILAGPRALGWHLVQSIGLSDLLGVFAPGTIARKRQEQWASLADAKAQLRSHDMFCDWDERVIDDYLNVATYEKNGKYILDYEPEVEVEVFLAAPHDLADMLRKNPMQCPVAHIGGKNSREQWLWGMHLTLRIARAGNTQLNGTHFFPMQFPELTAQAIDETIRKMEASKLETQLAQAVSA